MHALIAVVGPTGSGKSDLALALAGEFNGEIVNCDSLQVYRRLDIGTAKVPPGQRLGIPHHLLDVVEPDELFTAGEYARMARPVLHEIVFRRRLPVVAGGTGFYLKSLLEGLAPGTRRDPAVRARLVRRSPERLHRILTRFDPLSAARIHPHDGQKLVRAVEICLLSRRPLSEMHGRRRDALEGFRSLLIGLDPPRQELRERIRRRVERMFAEGLLEEVRGILDAGFSPDSKALESIGYTQALQVLGGRMTPEQAIEETSIATRQYAKRQWTWFRRTAGVHWLPGFGECPPVQSEAAKLVRGFLGNSEPQFGTNQRLTRITS